ncbi:MAG: endonuclease III [Candidatus Poseidoniaceae archaeon]|jgi:endonuclease-3
MRRIEKAERIKTMLDEMYPETPVPLDHRNPFELLIAVLMSAQTTDLKVNEVTPALFDAGPTPAAMAALDVDVIQSLIRYVGLAPTKAKNIKRLSEMLLEHHGGEVPASFEALEDLPGVGHKTAGVVMAQAFGVPAFPVDTHIHRLAARWGLSNGTNVERTERDLKAVFPKESWNDLHLQIIFFGREHCPARWHDLSTCPICSWAATKKRIEEERRMNAKARRR